MNLWDFKGDRVKTDLRALYASGISKASLDGLICSKCNSSTQVEMHHVRKMADLNPKLTEVDRLMISARRKQIPLCRLCHMETHRLATLNKRNQIRTKATNLH